MEHQLLPNPFRPSSWGREVVWRILLYVTISNYILSFILPFIILPIFLGIENFANFFGTLFGWIIRGFFRSIFVSSPIFVYALLWSIFFAFKKDKNIYPRLSWALLIVIIYNIIIITLIQWMHWIDNWNMLTGNVAGNIDIASKLKESLNWVNFLVFFLQIINTFFGTIFGLVFGTMYNKYPNFRSSVLGLLIYLGILFLWVGIRFYQEFF